LIVVKNKTPKSEVFNDSHIKIYNFNINVAARKLKNPFNLEKKELSSNVADLKFEQSYPKVFSFKVGADFVAA